MIRIYIQRRKPVIPRRGVEKKEILIAQVGAAEQRIDAIVLVDRRIGLARDIILIVVAGDQEGARRPVVRAGYRAEAAHVVDIILLIPPGLAC